MQRYKYFLAFFVATICLLGYAVLAQTKTQTQPAVISAIAPVFSPAVRALVLEGDYLVDVEIDRSGKVVSSKSAEGTRKIMQEITENAADHWQFAPDENAESKRRVQLTFTFSSVPKAAKSDSTTIFYPQYKIEVRDNREYPTVPSFRVK